MKFCYNIIQVQVGVSALWKGVFTMVAGHLSEKKGLDCSSKLISADAMLNGLGMDSK